MPPDISNPSECSPEKRGMSEWPSNQFTTNKSCIAFVKNIQIKKVLTCIAFNTTFYVLHMCTFFVKVDTLFETIVEIIISIVVVISIVVATNHSNLLTVNYEHFVWTRHTCTLS